MKIITTIKFKIFFLFCLTTFLQASAQCPNVAQLNQSFCDLQSPTIASLVATNTGGGIAWFATATSTTALSSSSGLVDGEDYFADSSAGNCGVRKRVVVTIYSAPFGQNFQGVCVDNPAGATISDLIAIGNNVKWYLQAIGGTPLNPSTILMDNTIYYATQTNPNTGCETSRLSVFVNVGVVPVPTGLAIQQFCATPGDMPTVSDLQASGTNKWYFTSSSAAELDDDEPLINGHSYFATTVDPPCESDSRLEVLVQFVAPTNAGNDATINRCQGASPTSINLFSSLTGNPNTSGTWTGPVAITGGHLGTINTSTFTAAGSPYVFTYTVSSVACTSDTATVTVNIVAPPTVSVSSNTTICSGASASVTFTGTPNAVVSYNVNGGATQTITLNGSGIATLTANYTATTNINVLSVTTVSPAACAQPVNQTVVITVLPAPVVVLGADVTICVGGTATITFTGNPNASVTYKVNGGPNQMIMLNASGTATITQVYNVTTTYQLVGAIVFGSPSCAAPQNDSMTVTVVAEPTASIALSLSVCPGGSANTFFTGTPNATVTYTINGGANQTILLNASGNATLTANYTVTTVIGLVSVSTSGGCTKNLSNFITINVRVPATVTLSSGNTICSGGTGSVTFTGTPNATITYTVNGGANQTIVLNSTGVATITNTYTSTTVYTLVSAALSGNPSCSQSQTGTTTITVIPPPTASLSDNIAICPGNSASVIFTATPNSTVTYTISGGPNQTIAIGASGTATITNTYSATTTFSLVSIATTGSQSCTAMVSDTMTITMTPAPTASIALSLSVCPGGSANTFFTGTPNATVTYTINGGANQTIVLNASGNATLTATYSVTTVIALVSVSTSGGCTQNLTGSITINVRVPATVTISGTASICSGQSATITFSGTPNATVTYTVNGGANQTIVLNASGTATITNTFTATTTYTLVTASLAGNPPCPTAQTGSVTITISAPPTVAISANQSICPGQIAIVTFTGTPNATVTYTVNGGANQTIVLNASGVASITNSYSVNTTFALVSVATAGGSGCSVPASGTSVISMTPAPTASIALSLSVCPGGSANTFFTGTPNATVTYTINGGANQTILLNASGNATLTATYSVTTVIALVSVSTSGGCTQNLTGSVTINVRVPATVTISGTASICSGQSATITFSGTPNATVTYTVNGGANQTIVLNASGSATITNTFSATTTYTLVSASLAGNPPCPTAQTGSATITIAQPPTVAISANQSICPGQIAIVTFTGTPNSTVTYTVNGGANQTIVLNASGVASITNSYSVNTTFALVSVATAGGSGCSVPASGTSVISMTPAPTASIALSLSVCPGGSANTFFTGTPNATVTYTINGGANQTILLNASGNATLTATYSVTTVIALVSVSTSGGCTQNLTGSVTINVRVPATVTISGTASICSGQSATITFSGTPNATVTYAVNGGANQTIVLNASGTATITNTFTATTTYTLVTASLAGNPPCPTAQTGSVTITVSTPPTATISANTGICVGENAVVTFNGTPNAVVTYNVNGGANQTITLDASGTATITTTPSASVTYNLVSVSSGGASGCSVPLTGSATTTVAPAPTATISANQVLCAPGIAIVTITGTPNSTVTYSVNGGANQTLVLGGSGNGLIIAPYSTTTTISLISISQNGTPSCTQLLSASTTISIGSLPVVTISSDVTICSGGSATVTFTGTADAIVTYTIDGGDDQTITLNSSGTATITNTYTATTTFDLVSVELSSSTACSQSQTGTMVITVVAPVMATISGNTSICTAGNATITFTGTPNATVTYTVNGGASQTITLNNSGTATISAPYSATTTFTLVNATSAGPNSCTQPLTGSAVITVLPLPTVAISINGSNSICAGSNATVVFTGTPDAVVTYTLNGGPNQTITLDNTGSASISVTPSTTATYTLVSVSVAAGACTQVASGSVTITVTPAPSAGVDVANVSFCSTDGNQDLLALLGSTAQSNGTWNPTLASGTNIFNPAIDAAGTYTYTVSGNAPCTPDSATITITITPAANAGTDATVVFCSNQAPQDLFLLLGATAQIGGTWFPTLNSGTGIFDPSIDLAGLYTYSLSGGSACGSDSATVTVSITTAANAGADATLTLCANSASQDLFDLLGPNAQAGGIWSPILSNGNIFDPTVDLAGIYSYTISGTLPCADAVATVTVVVNPIPDAGTDGTATFCESDAPADLFLSLGGTPQTGGTWSPALTSGSGVFDPATDVAGIYTYTVGGGLCDIATASSTVTVNPAPDAGIDGTITTCIAITSVDLFAALTGTPGAGTFADDDATGALSGTIFNPSLVGIGTYNFTYTVAGGSATCPADTSVVTVIVTASSNAGTFVGVQSVCSSAATFDLSTLLSGAQAGGIWTDVNNTTVTNPITITALTPATYSYTYTVSGCGTDSETVQFTLLESPTLTNANISVASPTCAGSNIAVNFTGLTDGDYTLTYTLSGSNIGTATVILAIAAGSGTIMIDSSNLPNLGATTITFNSIVNNNNLCGAILTGVSATFTISSIPTITDAQVAVSNTCLGSDATVSINLATGLSDGNYQFTYTLAPPGTASITSATVAILSGNGQFTIPASAFTTAGNYSITITGINNITIGCATTTANAVANFVISPVTNITGATISAPSVCLGNGNTITISGSGISDGTYQVTYNLSGASTATATVVVNMTAGTGTFAIAASDLTTVGTVSVSITQFAIASATCATIGNIATISFEVEQAQIPQISTDGNLFCGDDNPTVADLSSNIVGTDTIIWYDAAIGGNVLDATQLLQNGVTYYAATVTASGCQSATLPVLVDLTKCEEVPTIMIPDGFSPNEDGINDDFEIVNLAEMYPKFRLEIYNRYGNVLYKGNIDTPNWRGTATEGGVKVGNNIVPTGVYFFVIEFNDGIKKPIQGRVYLSR